VFFFPLTANFPFSLNFGTHHVMLSINENLMLAVKIMLKWTFWIFDFTSYFNAKQLGLVINQWQSFFFNLLFKWSADLYFQDPVVSCLVLYNVCRIKFRWKKLEQWLWCLLFCL